VFANAVTYPVAPIVAVPKVPYSAR